MSLRETDLTKRGHSWGFPNAFGAGLSPDQTLFLRGCQTEKQHANEDTSPGSDAGSLPFPVSLPPPPGPCLSHLHPLAPGPEDTGFL